MCVCVCVCLPVGLCVLCVYDVKIITDPGREVITWEEFKVICHASLVQPHPGDKSQGHETGMADKNKSLINNPTLDAKPSLLRLCLWVFQEWRFFFLICAHFEHKLKANIKQSPVKVTGGFINSKEYSLNTMSSKQLRFRHYFKIVVLRTRV